ncbi:MAG: hypothetical protein AB8B84_09730 [Granulosicoccus sp.]
MNPAPKVFGLLIADEFSRAEADRKNGAAHHQNDLLAQWPILKEFGEHGYAISPKLSTLLFEKYMAAARVDVRRIKRVN